MTLQITLRPQVGERVVAWWDQNETTVYSCGLGIYVGREPHPPFDQVTIEQIPEEERAWLADFIGADTGDSLIRFTVAAWDQAVGNGTATREIADEKVEQARARLAAEAVMPMDDRVLRLYRGAHSAPKIILDTGEVVWGHRCQWGLESQMDAEVAGRTVILGPPPETR